MADQDTICAVASGAPPSAIAIIRISGPETQNICDQMITPKVLRPREATRCVFRDLAGDMIDDGLVVRFAEPNSYTGEDSLEIYLHGGPAIVEHALAALTAQKNVRLAEPGEFTRRAFENEKLDLVQAEGVADLIEAETQNQKAQALRQLDGKLSDTYESWRAELISMLALLEVSIDFPDEDDAPTDTSSPVLKRIHALVSAFDDALADNGVGERIREGFRVAIIGPTNAGKSTLLNRLARRDAAIVTAVPGTTRDIIEVRLKLAGQIVWLADTAGLRETDDEIEAEGIRRAREIAEHADVRIFVSSLEDGPDAVSEPDSPRPSDVFVFNKRDLHTVQSQRDGAIYISAKTGAGVDELEEKLAARIREIAGHVEAPVITRGRHRARLETGRFHLTQAIENLEGADRAELAAEDVRLAIRQISAIVGEIDVEDVLSSVFSEFCIGK